MSNPLVLSQYRILKLITSNQKINCYVAEKASGMAKEYYIVNEIFGRTLIEEYIVEVTAMTSTSHADFVECFTQDSKFYAIFRYVDGTTLKEALQTEDMPIDFRFTLLKKILQMMVEHADYPNVIKVNNLNTENIVFEDNKIQPNYKFLFEDETIRQPNAVFSEVRVLIKQMFSFHEIVKQAKLDTVVNKCDKEEYKSFQEILKDLEEMQVPSTAKKESKTKKTKAKTEKKSEPKAKEAKIKEPKIKATMSPDKKKKAKLIAAIAIPVVFGIFCIAAGYNWLTSRNGLLDVYNSFADAGGVDFYNPSEEKEDIYVSTPENIPVVEIEEEPSTEIEEELEIDEEELSEEPEEEAFTIHIVQPGENLSSILTDTYGSIARMDEVIAFNEMLTPGLIMPGDELKMPVGEPGEFVPQEVTETTTESTTEAEVEVTPEPEPTPEATPAPTPEVEATPTPTPEEEATPVPTP
ncbi:MAG: hypothetical protein R3Y53_10945, partial [Bacillota bacterium]